MGENIKLKVLFLEWKNFGKEDVIEAMRALGIDVQCVEFEAMHERVNSEADILLDKLMRQDVSGKGYDAVFTFNYSPIVSNACKRNDLKYIAWIYDMPLVSLFSYTIINPCNYVFIFDSELYRRFANEGIKTVYYMPLAAATKRLDAMRVTNEVSGKYTSDISFVGSMYNEKHNLYERLSSMPDFAKGYLDGVIAAQMKVQGYFFMEQMLKGPVLEEMKKALEYKPNRDGVETPEYVYANYFMARKLAQLERKHLLLMLSDKMSDRYEIKLYTHNPTPELPKVRNMGPVDYYDTMPYVFKCSKINLNISLRSIQTGIPLRCMDILGAGGFLLTNYQADLFEYFVPDEDFVYYESDEDLLAKCEYYLTHDEERQRIARNGHAKITAGHTYEKTLAAMLETVFGENCI